MIEMLKNEEYEKIWAAVPELIEWENVREFKYNKNDILRAIKNNSFYQNYYWSYSKYNNILEEEQAYIPKKTKVYQYTLNGEFVREWESINECRKEFPSVLQVCLGKRTHCHNFSFDKLKI